MRIRISKDAWHFKLFKLATLAKARWSGDPFWEDWYEDEVNSSRINLCPYMRRSLIVMPLILLANAAAYGAIFFVCFIFPLMTIGLGSFYTVIGVVLAGVFTLFLVVLAVCKLLEGGTAVVKATSESTTPYRNLIGEYYKSVKHQICPVVEVEDPKDKGTKL